MAVRAAGRLAVARARIQAVEATGPVKPLMEPDTSQATPTLRGGAGTRRRSTRVKGFAVGMAPAARWASAAMACRIRSRPGGVAEAMTVSARPPALASRSARASRRAAACSPAVGSRVVPEMPPDPSAGVAGEDPGGGVAGLTAGACSRLRGPRPPRAGTGGGANSAVEASSTRAVASPTAAATGDGGPARLRRVSGRGGLIGGDAQDAAPAPAQPHHAPRVVIAGGVGLSPHLAELPQLALADGGGDRQGDGLGCRGPSGPGPE